MSPRRTRKRSSKNKTQKKRFLIYVEGEVTERDYLEKIAQKLGIHHTRLVVRHENATNPWGLFSEAKQHFCNRDNGFELGKGDMFFVVSDVSEHLNSQIEKDNFNTFKQKAQSEKGFLYVSNEPSFEFWMLLHFKNYSSGLDRKHARLKLKEVKGFEDYKKSLDDNKVQLLFDNLEKAIANAKNLGISRTGCSHEENPHTFMHELLDLISTKLK